MLHNIYKAIKELFKIKCCCCKKKFMAKEMWNWFGSSYACDKCFRGYDPDEKPKFKKKNN